MGNSLFLRNTRLLGLSALAGLALCLHSPLTLAQNFTGTKTQASRTEARPPRISERQTLNYDAYILGPGDTVQVELIELPELSGAFTIGPDGTLYLPRLKALYVEGLTIEELRIVLNQQFSAYVHDPQVYLRPIDYRPIRIYVRGEVKRPGYYTLTGIEGSKFALSDPEESILLSNSNEDKSLLFTKSTAKSTLLPTVFDAIRSAQGITPYTDLKNVQVIRKRAEGLGGGRIQTNLNILSLITEGDESQNIRIFDGDVLNVGRSPVVLREQLIKAGRSNLSPQFMKIFVTGRVNAPGGVVLPQGSSLNQAILAAGGAKPIKGKVEFARFDQTGTVDRRIFSYKPNAEVSSYNNPILAAGDIVRVQDSIFSKSLSILNEVTGPFVGAYSTYSIFESLK